VADARTTFFEHHFIREGIIFPLSQHSTLSESIKTMDLQHFQQAKLVVCNVVPHTFYNERKRAMIKMTVELKNGNHIVQGRNVPLQAKLHYENDDDDLDGALLECYGLTAIGFTGRIELSFRITEVSKRHHDKKFQIELQPDIDANPENADIRGVKSTPVLVKSKDPTVRKSNRKRKNAPSSSDESEDNGHKNPRRQGMPHPSLM
jgi:hypothetical protein